jgi:hypothetical protein
MSKNQQFQRYYSYLDKKWQFGYVVSSEMCQLKALEEILKENGTQGFNISQSWFQTFF